MKIRKPNGHIGSYEVERLHDWLLTDEKERKERLKANANSLFTAVLQSEKWGFYARCVLGGGILL